MELVVCRFGDEYVSKFSGESTLDERLMIKALKKLKKELTGDKSKLTGKISTQLYGDCSGLRGSIDDCKLSDEDRERGIDIKDLTS